MTILEQNKSLLLDAANALGSLDIESFLSHLSDDVDFETPVRHHYFQGRKTKDDLRQELAMMKRVLPQGVTLHVLSIVAEGDRVHAELTGEGRTAEGAEYNNRYHYAVQIRDGKIVEFRDYFDSLYVIEQLGPEIENLQQV